MENFSELIKNCCSMWKFIGEEFFQEDVVVLLKVVLMVFILKCSNSWQFIVVDDKKLFGEFLYCKEQVLVFIVDVVLVIVVIVDFLVSDVWIEDVFIVFIMIQFQVEDLGLGSCWVQVCE